MENKNEGFNILIGQDAGALLIDGHHNIYLGDFAGEGQVHESYHLRIGSRYDKQLTHRQWEMLYAALQWIIAGNDSCIGEVEISTGNDSTKIGSENKWYQR